MMICDASKRWAWFKILFNEILTHQGARFFYLFTFFGSVWWGSEKIPPKPRSFLETYKVGPGSSYNWGEIIPISRVK